MANLPVVALYTIRNDTPGPRACWVSDGVLVVSPLPKGPLMVLHVQRLKELTRRGAYAPGVHDEVRIKDVGGGGEFREEDAAASRWGL